MIVVLLFYISASSLPNQTFLTDACTSKSGIRFCLGPDLFFLLFPPFTLLSALVLVGHYLRTVIAKKKPLLLNFAVPC